MTTAATDGCDGRLYASAFSAGTGRRRGQTGLERRECSPVRQTPTRPECRAVSGRALMAGNGRFTAAPALFISPVIGAPVCAGRPTFDSDSTRYGVRVRLRPPLTLTPPSVTLTPPVCDSATKDTSVGVDSGQGVGEGDGSDGSDGSGGGVTCMRCKSSGDGAFLLGHGRYCYPSSPPLLPVTASGRIMINWLSRAQPAGKSLLDTAGIRSRGWATGRSFCRRDPDFYPR